MKKKMIFAQLVFLSLFAGMFTLLNGQRRMTDTGIDLLHYLESNHNYISNYHEQQSTIAGSPYMDRDFVTSEAIFSQKRFVDLKIRFNYYEGCFEFRENDQLSSLCPGECKLDTVWMEDRTFVFVNYLAGEKVAQAFMQLLSSSPTRVLLHQRMIIEEGTPAQAYKDPSPARFKKVQPEFYIIQNGEAAAKRFKGKGSVKELFPEHQSELLDYSKKKKLKLKKQQDIITLCQFYDSLP